MPTASVTVTAQAQEAAPHPDPLKAILLEVVKQQRVIMATLAEFKSKVAELAAVVPQVVDTAVRLRADVNRLTEELASGVGSAELDAAVQELDALTTQLKGALPE